MHRKNTSIDKVWTRNTDKRTLIVKVRKNLSIKIEITINKKIIGPWMSSFWQLSPACLLLWERHLVLF